MQESYSGEEVTPANTPTVPHPDPVPTPELQAIWRESIQDRPSEPGKRIPNRVLMSGRF